MNSITLITNDIELYNIFLNYKMFDKVSIASAIHREAEYDSLIVSDRMCGINELVQHAENGMKANKIVYLLSSNKSSQYNTLTALLKSHSISVLPPKLTDSQILSRFCELINLRERKINNVAVLFGADSKVGTTLTALSLAGNLAERSEGTVAFLNMSGHIAYSYADSDDGKGLDSIRSKVFNKILSQDELRQAMLQSEEIKNLYILPPCKTLIDFKYYTTDHIEYVISMAAGMFDIVIADAGWYPNNALYFGALNSTPNRYMVTTQQQSSLANHLTIKKQALDEYGITSRKQEGETKEKAPESILLIANRYSEQLSSNILKEYDMVQAVNLPNVPMAVSRVDEGVKSLRGLNKNYDRQLDKLANLVAIQTEYSLKQKSKGRRLFGR
ncbi:hypothetical protein LY28_03746 [Ruminiclostridium sufflavum DSM 19573]|uniref:MinD-like ATPase involved in chromosome partitioning or flagellar assembly n=1 Tax=Ruminiclostridium sufflavum DSM 19573 TaxID=1121337 RepID=A0A318XHA2_9FIRM|nr:hypothetical protein [Ruminiclostridium sufflavum]PYG84241.1 hypothetical protein LY28_03746 [Ruminiclostridium sufflavum DSM 19573]